jgi:hypothetical protein
MVAAVLALVPLQEDYFPLDPGTAWSYETSTGKTHVQRVMGLEKVGPTVCVVKQHGETEQFWLAAGKEGVFVHRAKGVTFEKPLQLFKFPLTKGESWQGEARSSSGSVLYRFRSVGEEEIEVPAGKYKAFRVDWTIEQGAAGTVGSTWLARSVGMVKQTYRAGQAESVLQLATFERPAGAFLPLAVGNRWVYASDMHVDLDVIYEIAGREKVGDADCFVLDVKTQFRPPPKDDPNAEPPPYSEARLMRKEWLSPGADGVLVHKLQRGRGEMPVDKPFYRVKSALRKGDEWEGEARAEANPPRYHYWVEEECDIEVPAGKFKAMKLRLKIVSGENHLAEGNEWWVKDVGLVKSEMTLTSPGGGATSVGSELREFRRGK